MKFVSLTLNLLTKMSFVEIETAINFLRIEEEYLQDRLRFESYNKYTKTIEKRIKEIHVEMENLEIKQFKLATKILKTD